MIENGSDLRQSRWVTIYRILLVAVVFVLSGCRQEVEEISFSNFIVGDPEKGEEAIVAYGCPACHLIPDIVGADALVGPPLNNWAERRYIAGTLSNTPTNLIFWLMDPQTVEPGTAMPDLGVNQEDARDIAAYLFTLGEGGPARITEAGEQPVPFSHRHHVEGTGIDCRYCHTSVAESSFAGMPSTHTCMSCHSQILTDAPFLSPVRESWEQDVPLPWVRIYDLPDFVRFDHAAHVNNGVGCDTCHGRVDQMLRMEEAVSMTMAWCLDCHRQPQAFLRPRGEVYNARWEAPENQVELGSRLVDEYNIQMDILTDCSLCHY